MMALIVAAVTVRFVVPFTGALPALANVAVITTEPVARVIAKPCMWSALLMSAMAVLLDDHATCVVRSCVEPSEYVPVAVYESLVPAGVLALAGVTAIEVSATGVTISDVVPVTPDNSAPMFAVPVATLDARPALPEALLIVATFVASDDKVTRVVMSAVVLSE